MGRVQTEAGFGLGYEEAGEGDRMPIVFLHGVGSDKSAWRRQIGHFGPERRAIAFDFPGYGESDAARENMTRDDYAEAIASAMRALGVPRAHICGLSLGGVVAIAMHELAPNSCTSLVLADSFAEHPEGRAIYDRALSASENMRVLAESRVDVLLAQPADPALRSEVVETMARIDPEAYRIGAKAVWLADQRERVHGIRVPTMVLCGAADRITPPALSTALQRLIPGARYEAIERAGHLSNMERPDEFNTLCGAFIRGVDSRS